MTIYEMLKEDIRKLSGVRIPIGDQATNRLLFEVLQDLSACAKAIEDGEKKKPEEKEHEGPTLEIVPADEADVEE